MGKPSPPPAPDYTGAAVAQGQANIASGQQTASLSNPNVTNPYGSQTVSYTPTGPNGDMQPNVVQSLNPQAQQTLDAQQRVQTGLSNLGEQGLSQAQNVLGNQFKYNGPGIQTSLGGYGQATGAPNLSGVANMPVNAGTTGQAALMARLQPQIDQSDAALKQQLANQGLTAGGEAYNNAQRVQGQQDNDLKSQAALYGIGLDTQANQQGYNQALNTAQLGNQAVAQNYGQALGAGQFGNTAAAQSLQQQLGLYNQPLNQITALESGSQIQSPQFQQYQGANIQAAPLFQGTQAQGNYAQQSYAQQMAGYNSMMGAVGGLFGAAGTAAGGGFFG